MGATLAAAARRVGQPSATSVRRYELDWLRTAAVFGLIPFHTAVIFTSGAYDYVKNAQTSAVMDFLTAFITLWGIPLLFLVAGGSARYALASRGVTRYLNERVTRLLVPFLFGMILIVPLQVYIGRLSTPNPPSFPVFYGEFLWGLALIFTGQIPRGPDWVGHLWFIPPLMIFAALAIPFARLLRTERGRAMVEWLAGGMRGYGAPLLLALPLGVIYWLTLEGASLKVSTNASFVSNAIGVVAYLLFFLYGYLLYLDERFLTSARRVAWLTLPLGAAIWLAVRYSSPELGMALASAWPGRLALGILHGYSGWWMVLGILGLAIHYLRFTNSTERYLARAAYPVYIIHMLILTVIAYWVVRMDASIALKFSLITILSLAISLAVYDVLIRRIGVLRLLFGLRTTPPANTPPTPRPGATPTTPTPPASPGLPATRQRLRPADA